MSLKCHFLYSYLDLFKASCGAVSDENMEEFHQAVMERVMSTQLQSKRILEKQLSEIEAKQRQNEVRRLKQIRDLGVDLTKIQKTTRDLDDVIQDLAPRLQEQRRGSLPPLDSRGGLPVYLEQSRTARSRRRLSCIAAVTLSSRDHTEYPNNMLSKKENMIVEKYKQLPPILTEKIGDRSTTSSAESQKDGDNEGEVFASKITNKSRKTQSARRNSDESQEGNTSGLSGSESNIESNEIDANNHTTNDNLDQDSTSATQDETLSNDYISESELQSIFADAKRCDRRSSEPELRGNFIRGFHDMTLGDIPLFQYSNDTDSEELRKSIQKNLPSAIVAEADEDEQETETNNEEESNIDISKPPNTRLRVKLSSISESDQDGDQSEDASHSGQQKHRVSSKEKSDALGGITKVEEKAYFKALRHRRKSDGDVLILDKTRKCNSGDRNHFGKSSRGIVGATTACATVKHNLISRTNAKQDFWKDVGECRYLRSHHLPEMNEPAEVTKFVFGRRNKD